MEGGSEMKALMALASSPSVADLSRALLHFLWQGLALALLAGVGLLALRRASANVRYLFLLGVLLLMLLAPIVTFAVLHHQPVAESVVFDAAPLLATHASSRPAAPVLGSVSREIPPLLLLRLWLLAHLCWLAALWAAGVCLLSLRLLLGWLGLGSLRRRAVRLDAWRARLEHVAARMGIRRRVLLLESARLHAPSVLGWLRPAILLPSAVFTGLTPEQLELVLAHELAHLRRHDYLVNVLQSLAETLLFYHPAVWWLSRRVRLERECCCDDLAVAACTDRVRYAQALTILGQVCSRGEGLAPAGSGSDLGRRVRRLLHVPASSPGQPPWVVGVVALGLVVALAVGLRASGPAAAGGKGMSHAGPRTRRRAQAQPTQTYSLQGHVYGVDGAPLANMPIEFDVSEPGLSDVAMAEATTDGEGAYRVEVKLPKSTGGGASDSGRWFLVQPYIETPGVVRPGLINTADPATYTADFHYAEPATVTGRQLEVHTGTPAMGVSARLAPLTPTLSVTDWPAMENAYFDEDDSTRRDDEGGGFTLQGVPPGEYLLVFEGWTVQPRSPQNGEAIPVTVKPGERVDVGMVEVKYVPHFMGTVFGLPGKVEDYEMHAVVRPAGSSTPGQQAFLWTGHGDYACWLMDHQPGKYEVVLLAWQDGQPRYISPVLPAMDLPDGTPIMGLYLTFTRGASIRGVVQQPNGVPLPDAAVTLRGMGGQAVMFNAPAFAPGPNYGSAMSVATRTDGRGEFAVQGLLPGEYEVAAARPSGARAVVRVRLHADEQREGVVLRTVAGEAAATAATPTSSGRAWLSLLATVRDLIAGPGYPMEQPQ